MGTRHVVGYQCWNVYCMQTVWRSTNVNSISNQVAVAPDVTMWQREISFFFFSRLFCLNNYFVLRTCHIAVSNPTWFVLFVSSFNKKEWYRFAALLFSFLLLKLPLLWMQLGYSYVNMCALLHVSVHCFCLSSVSWGTLCTLHCKQKHISKVLKSIPWFGGQPYHCMCAIKWAWGLAATCNMSDQQIFIHIMNINGQIRSGRGTTCPSYTILKLLDTSPPDAIQLLRP